MLGIALIQPCGRMVDWFIWLDQVRQLEEEHFFLILFLLFGVEEHFFLILFFTFRCLLGCLVHKYFFTLNSR